MDRYLEIELLPDPEFVPSVLMNALFGKLHRALAELNANRIGVSFPDVRDDPSALGDRLRLHGNLGDLQQLMELNWLIGMRDHILVCDPAPVPALARHRVVRRVQAKSSPERLRRRLVRRKGISDEEAHRAIPDSVAEQLRLPFVTIRSRSTEQTFRLFVEHQPPGNEAVGGDFSCYGLSPTATVPWF
jgi:CRISPR-associated endonuclease Csy4